MLLPLQGVLLFSIRTPKALPWAMCFWGFQPVLFDFWHTLFLCIRSVHNIINKHRKCVDNQPLTRRQSCGISKGVLLGCKRVRFGLQKESFWRVKGVLSECKRSPFEKQGNLEWKTMQSWVLFYLDRTANCRRLWRPRHNLSRQTTLTINNVLTCCSGGQKSNNAGWKPNKLIGGCVKSRKDKNRAISRRV